MMPLKCCIAPQCHDVWCHGDGYNVNDFNNVNNSTIHPADQTFTLFCLYIVFSILLEPSVKKYVLSLNFFDSPMDKKIESVTMIFFC